jgi:excisionase family DNA binding protein
MLTPKQVADAAQVTRRTVYRWIKRGELETVRVDNAHRVTEKQLAEKLGTDAAAAAFDYIGAKAA